jgi:hypothetical protein
LAQLRPLVEEFGAIIQVAPSEQEVPYPYQPVDEIGLG